MKQHLNSAPNSTGVAVAASDGAGPGEAVQAHPTADGELGSHAAAASSGVGLGDALSGVGAVPEVGPKHASHVKPLLNMTGRA